MHRMFCLEARTEKTRNGWFMPTSFSLGSSVYKRHIFIFLSLMLHAQFSEPTRVGQKGMRSVVSPTVRFRQTNSKKPHERAMILYIIDNENQAQHNFCLISYAACSQTETLTIIKVAQIAAIFPTRRIINLPGIPFWSCWRFLGW